MPASNAEQAALRATVRGCLAAVWPAATSAETGDLAGAWKIAIDQGWTEFAGDDDLGAMLAVVAELGELACPIPVIESFVAQRMVRNADVSTSGVVVVEADAARHVDAAELLLQVIALPKAGDGAAPTVRPVTAVTATAGL